MFYVYILQCRNKRFYVGCTNNLKLRVERHKLGYNKYTKGVLPVSLVYYCCFPNKYLAYNFEKYLKSGSGRAFLSKHLIKQN